MRRNRRRQFYTIVLALTIAVFSWTAGGCSQLLNALGSALDNAQTFENGSVDASYVYTRTVGGGEYYYNKLSAPQKQFYKKIRIDLDRFFDGKRTLKEYHMENETYSILGNYAYETFGLTMEQGLQAFDALYQDCPQYYAYDGAYMLYGEACLSPVIAPEYAEKSARDAVDEKIAAAVQSLQQSEEVLRATSNYDLFSAICSFVQERVNYEYDSQGNPSLRAHAGSIVGVLDGDSSTNSVCVGYTFTISYLCAILGVPCISVGNEALNHAWNMVKLDGVWYHMDATNADGIDDERLVLSCEKDFWSFFDCNTPAYDAGEEDTVSRAEILPSVSKDLCYSRFTYRNATGGLSASGALVNQRLLKLPSEIAGKAVVALGAGFALSASEVRQLILPTSVTKIEASATQGLKLEYIFYFGAQSQFELIEVGFLNNGFNGAQVCFYRSVKPMQDLEKYWHYDENGNPQVWADAE